MEAVLFATPEAPLLEVSCVMCVRRAFSSIQSRMHAQLPAGIKVFALLTWLVVRGAALLEPAISSAPGWQLGDIDSVPCKV